MRHAFYYVKTSFDFDVEARRKSTGVPDQGYSAAKESNRSNHQNFDVSKGRKTGLAVKTRAALPSD